MEEMLAQLDAHVEHDHRGKKDADDIAGDRNRDARREQDGLMPSGPLDHISNESRDNDKSGKHPKPAASLRNRHGNLIPEEDDVALLRDRDPERLQQEDRSGRRQPLEWAADSIVNTPWYRDHKEKE
jgi:hypothetical protein